MKQIVFLTICAAMLLMVGCAAPEPAPAEELPALVDSLHITGDGIDVTYTLDELKALPSQESLFSTEYKEDALYRGVSLPLLLEEAGFDLTAVEIVKVVASDGYTKNYDAASFTLPEATIAYERVDGPMDEDDGAFRLVFPGMAGEFSVRMVVELQVITG